MNEEEKKQIMLSLIKYYHLQTEKMKYNFVLCILELLEYSILYLLR